MVYKSYSLKRFVVLYELLKFFWCILGLIMLLEDLAFTRVTEKFLCCKLLSE